ncbi:MAG: metal-dependent hydrolase [Novosphingobium sp.]|uniref:metal-dependent hydrolase n=1 Tax=Novosphingobium sp. TaxID=1874826 RepID=UPI0032BC0D8D
MPTIISHALVPLAAAAILGTRRIPVRLALMGAILAMAPDIDVISFKLGAAYSDEWGHRGASHSLAFAGALAAALALLPGLRTAKSALFLFAAAASHGLLDMATDGGLGIALFWPFEQTRHFLPFTPIRVSPIGAGFFTARGAETIASELLWIWLPCAVLIGSRLVLRGRRTD